MNTLTILNQSVRTSGNLFSLNDLHKASGKESKHQPNRFLRSNATLALIDEINQYPDLGIALKTNHGGSNPGTWVCKELVYAYAMWISAKFHLQVIRAFDQMQAEQNVLPFSTVAPNCLILLTIENGQAKGSHVLPDGAFLTSPDRLSKQISESFRLFTKEQLQDIALECLNGVKRIH